MNDNAQISFGDDERSSMMRISEILSVDFIGKERNVFVISKIVHIVLRIKETYPSLIEGALEAFLQTALIIFHHP